VDNHSDQEHVIERLSRPSTNYLNYQILGGIAEWTLMTNEGIQAS